jgi:hypothetical protein
VSDRKDDLVRRPAARDRTAAVDEQVAKDHAALLAEWDGLMVAPETRQVLRMARLVVSKGIGAFKRKHGADAVEPLAIHLCSLMTQYSLVHYLERLMLTGNSPERPEGPLPPDADGQQA